MTRPTLPRIGGIDAPTIVAIAVVAIVSAFALFVPARTSSASRSAIEERLVETGPEVAGLEITTVTSARNLPSDDPFAVTTRIASGGPAVAPAPWDGDRVAATAVVEIPRYDISAVNGETPANPTRVLLQMHEGVDDHIQTVAAAGPFEPEPATEDEGRPPIPVVDVALSLETAERLGLALGDLLESSYDATEPVGRSYGARSPGVVLRVAELIELSDPADPFWWGDTRLHRPLSEDTPLGAQLTIAGLIRPDDFSGSPWTRPAGGGLATVTERRLLPTLDPTIDETEGWLDSIAMMRGENPAGARLGDTVLETGLDTTLNELAAARTIADANARSVLTPLVILAGLALVRLAEHSITRRRRVLAVLLARGSSPAQITGSATSRSAALGAIGAVVGVAASLASGAVRSSASIRDATLIVVVAAVVMAIVAATVTTSRLRRPLADQLTAREQPSGKVQRGVDIAVAAVALVAVISLRRRGTDLNAETATTALQTTRAVAITGLALVVGALARRLIVVLGRRLRWASVASDLGSRNVGSGLSIAPRIVDVVVLAAVVVGFGVATATALDTAADEASWARVGGPVMVDALLGENIDAAAVVAAAGADGFSVQASLIGPVAIGDSNPLRLEFAAVDAAALQDLTAADPRNPLGSADLTRLVNGRIPVLVPPEGIRNEIPMGTTIDGFVSLDGLDLEVVGVHRLRRTTDRVIVIDRGLAEQALGRTLTARSVVLSDDADLDAVADIPGVGQVLSRQDVLESIQSGQQIESLRSSSALSAQLAGAIAIAVAVMAAVLIVDDRRPQTALLGALGGTNATLRRLVTTEVLVGLAIAIPAAAASLVMLDAALEDRYAPGALIASAGPGGIDLIADRPIVALTLLFIGVAAGVGSIVSYSARRARVDAAAELRRTAAG